MRRKTLRYLASGVLASAVLLGMELPASASTAQPPPLIVVMMENHSYSAVVGNTAMPFLNSLWNEGAQRSGPVTDYTQMYSVTTSSMPNYLAITSGSTDGATGSTTPKAGEFAVSSLWDQMTAVGISWGVYEEGMPSACYARETYNDTATGGTDGEYVLGHNPGTLYGPVYGSAECQHDQPLSALSVTALPQVSFVAPNNCDNGHGMTSKQLATLPYKNCLKGSTALLQRGDAWLQQHVTTWTGAGADVLITWDEGGHIAALLTGPGVTPGQDATTYSHYSVLAGIEKLYGLPLLAGAATVSAVPLPGGSTVPSPPQVAIASPAGGSTVSGTLTVSGTAQAASGATISKVQVSVDGGTPVLASGTTAWSVGLDTTALSNGSHTITAQATDSNGSTGSASITVTVSNGVTTTACPAPPAGTTELSGNVSVESSQTGWTGVYNGNSVVTRVEPAGGSYDGLWAVQVALKAGTSGAAGVNNAKPLWVPGPPGVATSAGVAYTGSAFVRASVAGETIRLLVREVTASGKGVGYHTTAITLGDTGWHQITSAYAAKNTGDELRYYLYASHLANSGQNFLADCLSLWQS